MPKAPPGSVTGNIFCLPFGPTLTTLPGAAGTTTSPVFVAAADAGPPPSGNADSTLTCTPGAAACAEAASPETSKKTTVHTSRTFICYLRFSARNDTILLRTVADASRRSILYVGRQAPHASTAY